MLINIDFVVFDVEEYIEGDDEQTLMGQNSYSIGVREEYDWDRRLSIE